MTSPTALGRKGSDFFSDESKSPSAWSNRLVCSSRASSRPSPIGVMASQEKMNRPELSKYVGLIRATTVAPSVNGPAESRVVGEAVTDTETSASLSRKVRKIVRVPERRLISINCASTQTAPSRSTQPRTARAITRRGCGCSGEDSKATPRA